MACKKQRFYGINVNILMLNNAIYQFKYSFTVAKHIPPSISWSLNSIPDLIIFPIVFSYYLKLLLN
jgi:hypothetical protein